MKLYTKKGDKCHTSFYDGRRELKCHPNFEAVGLVDELSVNIGFLCTYTSIENREKSILREIQSVLQDIGTYIATENKNKCGPLSLLNKPNIVTDLELSIDEYSTQTPKLTAFILPCVTEIDARSHLCRVMTRKTERKLVKILKNDTTEISLIILRYMNRLSDFFFALARWLCYQQGNTDIFRVES